MAKLITVFGATGAQGKSLAEALLGDGGYKVRAPTRNPDSSEAKSLGENSCEVVKVDMDDADSLEKAITGSYGVFVDANYWGLLVNRFDTTMDREIRNKQGKTIGDICKKTGVKHLVYCGMEHVEPGLGKPRFNTDGIVDWMKSRCQILLHVSLCTTKPSPRPGHRRTKMGHTTWSGLWTDLYMQWVSLTLGLLFSLSSTTPINTSEKNLASVEID